MESSKAWYFYMALVALLGLTIGYIDCGDRPPSTYKSGRFHDIAKAISFMHTTYTSEMPLEEKCKRYAVFLAIGLKERLPFDNTVLSIVGMDEADLEEQYKQMGASRLSWLYMCAIDRFRVTELAPPVVELAECLKLIDHHGARKYLENPELVIILGLYKRVLGMPTDTVIDLATLDFEKFHSTFPETLRNLFSKYFDIDKYIGGTSAGPRTSKKDAQRDQKNRRRQQSRLQLQRMRLMKSDVIQKYQDDRRDRDKRKREILSIPTETLEELEIKRDFLARRERRNERERAWRRALRQRRLGRLGDIAQAINFIQTHLPDQISKEEKCRRYAVLADIASNEKLPSEETALKVVAMDKHDLDKHYDQIGTSRLKLLYMWAIDRYRLTDLAPPMIELAECLEQVDQNGARKYLDNPEFVITLGLYKQVLGLPSETTIDLAKIDFKKFPYTFRDTLTNLFSRYFDIGSIIGDTSIAGPSDSEKKRRDLSRSRRRELSRLHQQRFRMAKSDALKKLQEGPQNPPREQREAVIQPANRPVEAETEREKMKRQNQIDRRIARRRELRQQKRSREQQQLRDESDSLDAYDARLADELLELYNSLPDDTQSQHMGQEYNDLLQRVTTGMQTQGASLESALISFEPNSQEESRFHQELRDSAARWDKAGSVVEFLLDEPTTSETRVVDPEVAHDDPHGVYIPRPISPHRILDTNISMSSDTFQDPLADVHSEMHDSMSNGTESQHPGQEYGNLHHKDTSGTQSQGANLESTLISFEPNCQEKSQFRQQLEDYSARFDKAGSVVEFLLDEPTTSETREVDPEVAHDDPLGVYIPRISPVPPHSILDTDVSMSNDTFQNLLMMADVPLKMHDSMPGQGYDNLHHQDTSGKQSQGANLGSPSISIEPSSQEESQLRQQLEDYSARFDSYDSIVKFLFNDSPTDGAPGKGPDEPKRSD